MITKLQTFLRLQFNYREKRGNNISFYNEVNITAFEQDF